MQIYWNKRKCLHKKRVQLPQDWFGTPTWPPFLLFWDTNMATVTSCENTLQVKGWHKIYVKSGVQLKFSKTATLGTEESGLCRVRFKQESLYGLSVKKSGRCREMAGAERWPLIVEIQMSMYSSNKTYSHLGFMRWLPHKVVELSVTVNNSPLQDYTGSQIKLILIG